MTTEFTHANNNIRYRQVLYFAEKSHTVILKEKVQQRLVYSLILGIQNLGHTVYAK